MKDSKKENSLEFIYLCKSHDLKTLCAFSSATNTSFNEDSNDLDLLVELETKDPITRGQNLINLWEKFESFFLRKVDPMTNSSVRNPILRKNIDASKILIYDGKEQKVSF